MTLTVGEINYANVYPIFNSLRGTQGLKFVKGVPSHLNRALSEGAIDLAFCSSIEYARGADKYLIIPDISISCLNRVKSVMLFSKLPVEELSGEKIYLTGESGTSVVLLEIILREYYGLSPVFTDNPDEAVAELNIGDRALFKYYNEKSPHVYDMCFEWNRFTGLPFVFALWIVRRETAETKRAELERFISKLSEIKEDSKNNLAALLDHYTFKGLSNFEILDYWETICYDLTEKHVKGLLYFYSLAKKLGRIKEIPPLRFFV